MSYQQMLNQYTNKMSDVRAHSEEMENQNIQSKANELEAAFNHITAPITAASEGISSAAGAFHTGRKIYNKVKAKRLLKAKAQKGQGEDTEGSQSAGNDGAAQAAKAEGNQVENSAAPANDPSPAPQKSIGDTDQTDSVIDAMNEQATEGAARGAEAVDPAAEGAANPESLGLTLDRPGRTLNIATKGARQAPFQRPDDAPQQQRPPTEPEEGPQPQSEADKLGEPQAGEPSYSTGSVGSQATDPNLRADTLEGDIGNQGGASGISEGASAAEQGGSDAISTLTNTASRAGTLAGKAVSKAASTASDLTSTVPEALEGASSALDFLGPVGLGVGAITGLVDLFENIFNKPKDAGDIRTAPQTGEGAGVDLGAMASKTPTQVAV